MPKYDPLNRLHQRLVVISKFASLPSHIDKRRRASAIASLAYARLCKEDNCRMISKPYKLPEKEEAWKVAEDISENK